MIDAKAFGEELAGIVKAAVAPVMVRLDALEKRLDAIPAPEALELPDIPAMVADAVAEAVKAIPTPRDGRDGAPGERGEPGRDGLDVKDLFRAEGGRLVAVMSDGTTKDLGCFVGADGKDGADGLGFDDMDFEVKDGRLFAVFRRGDLVKEARLPGISYRGGWKAGEYLTGDSVTFGSCQWIATEDTDEKPGEGKAWQLAVRKGRDARGT